MSKPARKRPRPPASGEPATAPEVIEPTPEPTAKAEPKPTPSPREPVNSMAVPGGCYIKSGVAVDANGNPIVGLVVIDGTVYREAL